MWLTRRLGAAALACISLALARPCHAADGDFAAFLKWASEEGVEHDGRFEIATSAEAGKGLVAARAFAPGELLLATPRAVMLTPDSARESEMGTMFAQAGLAGCPRGDATSNECTALLVFHLISVYHNASTPFAPWMRVLPRELSSPMFWSEDEYEELAGCNLYDICNGWKQSVKALFQSTHQKLRARFPAEFGKRSIYSLHEFLWGWGLIYSRAFDIEVPVDLERDRAAGSGGAMLGGAKERQRVMAPVVDMFNHALVESSYQYNAVARQFELYTGKFYREGEEVFLNYDPKSNADYLMQYGFVVEGNAHDFVGMVASIGPDAPYYKDKEILLKQLGFKMSDSHRLQARTDTHK